MSALITSCTSSSDITTLTSASYQPGLQMHAGQHLLSIQGKFSALRLFFSRNILYREIINLFLTSLSSPHPFLSPPSLSGSPVSHSRPGALLGERTKQLFPPAVIPVSKRGGYLWGISPQVLRCSVTLRRRTTFSAKRHFGVTNAQTSSSTFRAVTIRRRDSAQAQQSTASSAGVRGCTSHTEWPKPSIPLPTLLDHLYQSVLQAAPRSEVQHICIKICNIWKLHTLQYMI